MKPEEIHINDWYRILIGEVPVSFYLELILRALIVYIFLLISMRLMGKRMGGLLGRNEMAAMVSLAAASGTPLTDPSRGILPAIVIAIVVVYIERLFSSWAFKHQHFEQYALGNISMLIKDGVMDMEILKKTRLTRQRTVAQLRSAGIKQLGSVKRFYMETSGSFTLIKDEEPQPGLSILPHWDVEFYEKLKKAKDVLVCANCGKTEKQPVDKAAKCVKCGQKEWIEAVSEE